MNDTKVCFITCVNNDHEYSESLKYINSLYIPDGFTVETIGVKDASSMTEGYQAAMMQSDAKYKVYLHQDIFIINKNFIKDIITLFSNNAKLGLLGVVGAEKMSVNGIWWESPRLYGKFYDSHTGKMERFSFNEAESDYMAVQTIDGLIMVTQYDINWRTDLFQGWHFYDASQSAEFIRAGYEVGVPTQQEPWVIHDSDIASLVGFEEAKAIYMEEYTKDIFPLVSVLIPTYNRPHYFELALKSVLEQTYKNIEIVVCDDSSNDETEQLIQKYLMNYPNIRYYKNEVNLFVGNFHKCHELATGEFINYLMDDDLFHPEKIERMASYLMNNNDVTLVTSHRILIDDQGNPLFQDESKNRLFNADQILDGQTFGNHLLTNCCNLVGEPTTAMFRKNNLSEKFGIYKMKEYSVINDLATWIALLSKGKVAYISQGLSYFRQHQGQNQMNPKYYYLGIIDWLDLIVASREDGFLNSQQQYKNALSNYLKMALNTIDYYLVQNKTQILIENNVYDKCEFAIKQLLR